MMEKNSYGQMKCPSCGSWHFSIYLDEMYKPLDEVKCCKCNRFYNMNEGVVIDAPKNLEAVEKKNQKKLVGK